MDDATRTAVILAAINAAGPMGEDDWEAKAARSVATITTMVSERSPLARVIEQMEAAKVFRGSVLRVKREESSTRGVVTLWTDTDRENTDAITKKPLPAGCEQVRTERTDNPAGMFMARSLTDLIGHDVRVWVEVEAPGKGDRKYRVLRHVQDLGLSDNEMAVEALAARKAQKSKREAQTETED